MDAGTCSQGIINYHERTKHYPDRYARSSGFLDWANMPDPFRRYEGTPPLRLPLMEEDPEADYVALFERKDNSFKPFSLKNTGAFLELSMGLSAWKSVGGDSWALRMNPSSGNLHPTEAHLVLPPFHENDNHGGVFHYNPFLHALEPRAKFDGHLWQKIKDHLQMDGFLVGLSTIYWRESWKYGERAFRYCNLDVGHALACLSFSANLMGWKTTYLNALSDKDIEIILGFQKTEWRESEKENADILLFVHKGTERLPRRNIPSEIIRSFESLSFTGKPNSLSRDHVDWNVIDEVSSMSVKPVTADKTYTYKEHAFIDKDMPSTQGSKTIRRRRSGQAYDGKTSIPKENLFAILDRTIPRSHSAPFDLELGRTCVHLLIFVHCVSGLESGLYFLFRSESPMSLKDTNEQINPPPPGGDDKGEKAFNGIKGKCHAKFLWERVSDAPETLPLYLLIKGDFREEAAFASCRQDIAGDGAFSVGMITEFREVIESDPHSYRRLFWEAGMIGQVLYLEAEANSVRGTGIGCFYDDLVHQLLGLSDNSFQDIYHFTVGRALEDTRLITTPPYEHLKKSMEVRDSIK